MGFDRFHLVLGRALSGLCLVVTAPAAAFAAQPETCLSFEHALRIAAERAPEVAGAIARQDEAAADYREAESLRLPQLSTFGRTASGDSGLR